jgi:hypothetical protein
MLRPPRPMTLGPFPCSWARDESAPQSPKRVTERSRAGHWRPKAPAQGCNQKRTSEASFGGALPKGRIYPSSLKEIGKVCQFLSVQVGNEEVMEARGFAADKRVAAPPSNGG